MSKEIVHVCSCWWERNNKFLRRSENNRFSDERSFLIANTIRFRFLMYQLNSQWLYVVHSSSQRIVGWVLEKRGLSVGLQSRNVDRGREELGKFLKKVVWFQNNLQNMFSCSTDDISENCYFVNVLWKREFLLKAKYLTGVPTWRVGMGQSVCWWGCLYVDGTAFLLMRQSVYWWGSLYVDGTVCVLMGQSVCWWDSLSVDEAVCMSMGQSVCWWGSPYVDGAVCMLMGQSVCWWGSLYTDEAVCMLMGQSVCWWGSLYVDGAVCMLMGSLFIDEAACMLYVFTTNSQKYFLLICRTWWMWYWTSLVLKKHVNILEISWNNTGVILLDMIDAVWFRSIYDRFLEIRIFFMLWHRRFINRAVCSLLWEFAAKLTLHKLTSLVYWMHFF